jgi:ABC-type phosphate/phosphonate transport system substrate-binding protein
MPVANARMYSAAPDVKRAWHEVFAWALQQADLSWDVIDFDPPAPLGELWARGDLGCVMMCGAPYSRRDPRPALVAAPIPSPARYGGRAIYFTDIAVRADAPYQTLEETFGGVIGYTLEDSMSGCIALRTHLRGFRSAGAPRLYRQAVGGLLNPRRVIEAMQGGEIDVGPLDSYYYDLLKRNDPQFAARVRVIATTAPAPIPPLIATASLAPAELERLRAALLAVRNASELATQRDTLLLAGFAVPEAADYDVFAGFFAAAEEYRGVW